MRNSTPPFVSVQLDVLPEIVEAVGGRAEVYLDGGVRRGTDVLKALALGAKAVFLGRPVLWGLAYEVRLEHRREKFKTRSDLFLIKSKQKKMGFKRRADNLIKFKLIDDKLVLV